MCGEMDNQATTPLAIVQAQHLPGHTARMPDETDAKKILTASPWRTGGDHQDALILRG